MIAQTAGARSFSGLDGFGRRRLAALGCVLGQLFERDPINCAFGGAIYEATPIFRRDRFSSAHGFGGSIGNADISRKCSERRPFADDFDIIHTPTVQ